MILGLHSKKKKYSLFASMVSRRTFYIHIAQKFLYSGKRFFRYSLH